MSRGSLRIAGLRLALAFAVIASLAFANLAHAGLTFPFAGGGACNDPNDVIGSLTDASTTFNDSPPKSCVLKCKRVVKDCKAYVNDAYSCQVGLVSDYGFYRKQGCKDFFQGQERQLCFDELEAFVTAEKTSAKATRDARRVDCDGWGATCIEFCPQ
jgi:hypothetical protein